MMIGSCLLTCILINKGQTYTLLSKRQKVYISTWEHALILEITCPRTLRISPSSYPYSFCLTSISACVASLFPSHSSCESSKIVSRSSSVYYQGEKMKMLHDQLCITCLTYRHSGENYTFINMYLRRR